MSSIDKYVAGEARKYNPDVKVEHIDGRLVGKINGREVFSIADRYGYLNKEEESIIKSSMLRYEEEEKERIRIENEQRVLARNRLSRDIRTAKEDLTHAFENAKSSCDSFRKSIEINQQLNAIGNLDISSYRNRVAQLRKFVDELEATIKRKNQTVTARLDQIATSVTDEMTSVELNEMLRSLSSMDKTIELVILPTDEVKNIRDDLQQLGDISLIIADIQNQLESVESKSKLKQHSSHLLETIRTYKITSVQDAQKLLNKVQSEVQNIKSELFSEAHSHEIEEIKQLKALEESITRLNVAVSPAVASANYRREILEQAQKLHSLYLKLAKAEYTTCNKNEITRIIDLAQSIINGDASDKVTLENLNNLIKQGGEYQTQDLLLRSDYEEYREMLDELIERGVDVSAEDQFDVNDYESQRDRLFQMFAEKDNQDTASRTSTSFIVACETMEEMGYKMLAYDMRNTLAQEAIYLNPKYPDVAVQIIASGTNVTRRTIGLNIQGKQTSIERVLEITKIMDADNDPYVFLEKYWEKGERFDLASAIDETMGDLCREAIVSHGFFTVEEEGISKYKEIMNPSEANAEIATNNHFVNEGISTTRKSKEAIEAECGRRIHENSEKAQSRRREADAKRDIAKSKRMK